MSFVGAKDPAPFHAKASTCNQVDSANHEAVFLLEYPCPETLHVVTVENGNPGLNDDRASVNGFVHEMNRAPGDPHAVFEGLALCVKSLETREQRRVHIDHASREFRKQFTLENAHETGEQNKIRARLATAANNLGFRTGA